MELLGLGIFTACCLVVLYVVIKQRGKGGKYS